MRIRTMLCMMLLAGVAAAQGTPGTTPKTVKSGASKSATKPAAKTEKAEKTEPAAKPAAAATPEVTKELVETFLQRVYGWNQAITFKLLELSRTEAAGVTDAAVLASTPEGQQLVHFYVTPDGNHVIMGDLVTFGADPFAEQRALLASESFGTTVGPLDAAVTVVEFADLQCPACKAAQVDVEKVQKDFPQVKFVFQSFPLDQMHPWANQASRYLDCIQRESNEKAQSFLQTVFIHQGDITPEIAKEKLNKYTGMAGADAAKISACSELPETKDRIARSQALGRRVKITGTPSIFVNGHPAIQRDYEHLKAIIEYELTHLTTTK